MDITFMLININIWKAYIYEFQGCCSIIKFRFCNQTLGSTLVCCQRMFSICIVTLTLHFVYLNVTDSQSKMDLGNETKFYNQCWSCWYGCHILPWMHFVKLDDEMIANALISWNIADVRLFLSKCLLSDYVRLGWTANCGGYIFVCFFQIPSYLVTYVPQRCLCYVGPSVHTPWKTLLLPGNNKHIGKHVVELVRND